MGRCHRAYLHRYVRHFFLQHNADNIKGYKYYIVYMPLVIIQFILIWKCTFRPQRFETVSDLCRHGRNPRVHSGRGRVRL